MRQSAAGNVDVDVDDPVSSIQDGLSSLSLKDEDDALEGAKALAIQVKESCHTADKLTLVILKHVISQFVQLLGFFFFSLLFFFLDP